MSNTFTWKTKFKSIIIVDGELFANEYKLTISLTPHTASLKEQTEYFDRLKNLFEQVFANTITTWRDEPLYNVLKKSTTNRFIELPKFFLTISSILLSLYIVSFISFGDHLNTCFFVISLSFQKIRGFADAIVKFISLFS